MGHDNLTGITVGGKDLKEHLQKEAAKEAGEALEETKVYPKKRGSKVRYMEQKQKAGEVKRSSQASLNIINLEANVAKAKMHAHKIICYLLAEKLMTSQEVTELLSIRPSDSATILRKIYGSALGQYVVRTGSRGSGFRYQFNDEALNLAPRDAIHLYTQRKPAPKKESKTVTSNTPEKVPPGLAEIRLPDIVEKDVHINVTVKFKIEWEV